MSEPQPIAIHAQDIPLRQTRSSYPEPFQERMNGREKRVLGNYFGLKNFGVNLTQLAPNAVSALRHSHTHQDEFIYILEGHPTLITNAGKTQLSPGMCAGFPANSGDAHQLINETTADVVYLEIGDRTAADTVTYPDDDLEAIAMDGKWQFRHKDGTLYNHNSGSAIRGPI